MDLGRLFSKFSKISLFQCGHFSNWIVLLLLNLPVLTVEGAVTFQEDFEGQNPRFFSVEIQPFEISDINGSKAVFIGLNSSGYYRFSVPFPASRVLRFDLNPLNIRVDAGDSLFGILFVDARMYDTSQASYWQSETYLGLFYLEQTGRIGLFSNLKDTLLSMPLVKDRFNTIIISCGQIRDSLMDANLAVNGRVSGSVRFVRPQGKFTVLTCGNNVFGRSRAAAGAIALDNLVTFDSPEDPNALTITVPPVCSVFTRAPARAALSYSAQEGDSLCTVEMARSADFEPLLFQAVLPIDRLNPFVIDFPLRPGEYYLRMNCLKKSGLKTGFSVPARLVITDSVALERDLRILDAAITDEATGQAVSELMPERAYILSARFSTVSDCYSMFYLHHAECAIGNPVNRAGHFDRRENYIFNFSLGNAWMLGSREDVKGRSIRVNGRRDVYLDDADNFFKVDTVLRTSRVRFRLLREARSGEWILSGYLEDSEDKHLRSYLFEKPFQVLSRGETEKRLFREKLVFAAKAASAVLLLLFLLVSILLYLRRKKRLSAPAPSLLSVLREKGIVIDDENNKNRHLVQRIQQFALFNLNRDISLSDIAAHLDLSPTWTGILHKQATGLTVVQFVNRIKIERAQEMLKEGNLSATDVGMSVGFPNPDHFRRVFKEMTGVTPGEFRKKR